MCPCLKCLKKKYTKYRSFKPISINEKIFSKMLRNTSCYFKLKNKQI